MSDDRWEALDGLGDEGAALLRRARSAARAPAAQGSDATGSVAVGLNEQGRVATVTVARTWQSHLTPGQLGEAVVQAVQDAALRRLTAWGEAYAEPAESEPQPSTGVPRRQLDSVTAGASSAAEREAALVALLEVVESIERGLDEVSGKLRGTLNATHIGHSPHREVTVELTGGGDVTAVRFHRVWLRDAHEATIARQVMAAFRTAYEQVTAHGVDRLIADSALGEAQWVLQDPAGFVRGFGTAGR